MNVRLAIVLAGLSAPVIFASDARLEEARQALEEGLPQVAIYKLQQSAGKSTAREDRPAADLLLGRALIAAGRFEESVAVLERLSASNSPADFWLAEAYSALNKPDKALPLYGRVSGDPTLAAQAVIGESRMLMALHREAEAVGILSAFLKNNPASNEVVLELAGLLVNTMDAAAVLKSLTLLQDATPAQRQSADYLSARALLLAGEYAGAEEKLKAIQDEPAELAASVALAKAECRVKQNDPGEAEKFLEAFVEDNARLPGLDGVFAALDRVYAAQAGASRSELRRWSDDLRNPARAALAQYYYARNESRVGGEKGRQLYGKFLEQNPGHPLCDQALGELAASHLADGDPHQALTVAQKGGGPRIDYIEGQALAALGQYKEAAAKFFEASRLPGIEAGALTNSAICGLLADVPTGENRAILRLRGRGDSGEILQEINFYEALHRASQRKPEAADLLRKIAGSDSRWSPRARLALAEWDNLQLNTPGAQAELRRISSADPAQKERADYLGVFLADTGDHESELRVGGLAATFLKEHANSPFEPEVRMKLGEMLYRRGDYLGAHGEFATIAEKFPDSPLAEKAAFLSAQAMSRSMSPEAMEKAIEIYNEVVKEDGSLSLRARLSQAMLFNALKRPKDALGVFDRILASKPDAELRSMTLIEKGDTLFAQGGQDPNNYKLAIAAWKEVASEAGAPKIWRHQALVKMGAAYKNLGSNDAALDCYYSVFSQGQKGEPEYFWYYKAGFDAARLLEGQNLWKEAIAVYERIGAIDGPRAGEARDRVNKLRLENFIWEN